MLCPGRPRAPALSCWRVPRLGAGTLSRRRTHPSPWRPPACLVAGTLVRAPRAAPLLAGAFGPGELVGRRRPADPPSTPPVARSDPGTGQGPRASPTHPRPSAFGASAEARSRPARSPGPASCCGSPIEARARHSHAAPRSAPSSPLPAGCAAAEGPRRDVRLRCTSPPPRYRRRADGRSHTGNRSAAGWHRGPARPPARARRAGGRRGPARVGRRARPRHGPGRGRADRRRHARRLARRRVCPSARRQRPERDVV